MSTEITPEQAEEILKILDGAYKHYYGNSENHLKLLERRTKSKKAGFYKQVAEDSLEYSENGGFSYSWLWDFFFKKGKNGERRNFNDNYVDDLNYLISYYDNNTYPKKPKKEEIDEVQQSIPDELKEKRPIKKNAIVLTVLGIILLSVLGYFGFEYRKNSELRRVAKEREDIIENSRAIRSVRTTQLTNLVNAINTELGEDVHNDGMRNLSKELVGRIVTLSEEFEPYLFEKDGNIIPRKLSPERGKLFLTLFRSELETNVFNEIITKSNFTYSDLSGSDLNGLDLSKGVYGIEGSFNNEVEILLTPSSKVNFDHSSFRGAKMNNAFLYGSFVDSDFRDISSYNLTAVWSQFNRCNFQGNELRHCRFERSTFNHANFKKTTLGLGPGYGRGFIDCDLRGVIFDGSSFSGGDEAFRFENCFFSSSGTFFYYSLNIDYFDKIHLKGDPFIDGHDNFHPMDCYEILQISKDYSEELSTVVEEFDSIENTLGFSRFIDRRYEKTGNIVLNKGFRIFNEPYYDEREMFNRIDSIRKPTEKTLYWMAMRTNDNVGRNWKVEREFTSFYGASWDMHNSVRDTMYRRSSLNRLQSEYRGQVYDHLRQKDTLYDGTASFKGCSFVYTHFVDSGLENVSFKDAKFTKYTENIANRFIRVRLKKNDFRIKSGTFMFSTNTDFDSLYIDTGFPLLKYQKNRDSLLGEAYYNRVKKGNQYDATHYLNLSEKSRDSIMNWLDDHDGFIELIELEADTGKYLLINTSVKPIEFKQANLD